MEPIVSLNFWQRRPWRWLAMVVLTTFVAVQASPYLALGATTPPGRPSQAEILGLPDGQLLAQLDQLLTGTLSLPNFDPAVNGFQFSNRELVEAIDLNRNAQNWEVVLTEQLKQLFGTQVCVGGQASGCVLTAAAQGWLQTQLGRIDQGISEGMAAAVLDLWQPSPTPIPWWQRLINALLGRTVFGLVRTLFDLQTFIANLFLLQGVPEVFQPTQVIRNTLTPTQILLTLVRVLLSGSADPYTMGIYRQVSGALTEGHSLTPYQIESRGDGKYWVYVYDSNYPAGRSTSPPDLHVEFDIQADTWVYEPLGGRVGSLRKNLDSPVPDPLVFEGDAESKTLDLTRRSWRQPGNEFPTGPQVSPTLGPLTCPFCEVERSPAEGPAEPTLDITLMGEGLLTVTPYSPNDGEATRGGAPRPLVKQNNPAGADQPTLVPFKGGLGREVPASYHLTSTTLGQPLQVDLTGVSGAETQPTTLQFTGPGFSANIEGLVLTPDQTVTIYLVAAETGPEMTFVANQNTAIPRLVVNLIDGTTTQEFDASSPRVGFARTERQVSKSSGFTIAGLRLTAGQRVALTVKTDLKRLYFADDDFTLNQYGLTARNRMVVRDRTQIGERQPDFTVYTLTYDEEMTARGIPLAAGTQAFFDYDPAFIDPGTRSADELVTAFAQRNIPVTIAYEPLTPQSVGQLFGESVGQSLVSGPLALVPSGEAPIDQRVFQGSLGVRELVWDDGAAKVAIALPPAPPLTPPPPQGLNASQNRVGCGGCESCQSTAEFGLDCSDRERGMESRPAQKS
jgi:hypothetical protein